MKKIPKKKRKATELYFNEYDGTAEERPVRDRSTNLFPFHRFR